MRGQVKAMTMREAAVETSRTPAEPRRCPACGMGIDDSSLELCPLCFYDLDGAPPEGFDDGPSASAPSAGVAASRVSGRGGPCALDAVIAAIPLIVLILVLVVALIER